LKPSPEVAEEGLRAYERTLAFAQIRKWRLPVMYGVCLVVPVLMGLGLWQEHYTALAYANFAATILVGYGEWLHWQRLLENHAKDAALLAELAKTYGDELLWVQVEKHFAELEKLKGEAENEERRTQN